MTGKLVERKEVSPQKLKDMVESILPCKGRSRKVAYYWKRHERRRVRHSSNLNLKSVDQEGYTIKNLKVKYYQSPHVWQRRGSDKLNHFMHWGERLTVGMSEEEALNYVRHLLPRNLIGDHAYSHWQQHVKSIYKYRVNKPEPVAIIPQEEASSPTNFFFYGSKLRPCLAPLRSALCQLFLIDGTIGARLN